MLTPYPKRLSKQRYAQQAATSVARRRLWDCPGKRCIAAWNALGCAPEDTQVAPQMEHRRKVGRGAMPVVSRCSGLRGDSDEDAWRCAARGAVDNSGSRALLTLGSAQIGSSDTTTLARDGGGGGELSGRRFQPLVGRRPAGRAR